LRDDDTTMVHEGKYICDHSGCFSSIALESPKPVKDIELMKALLAIGWLLVDPKGAAWRAPVLLPRRLGNYKLYCSYCRKAHE
jgi:hypothetical protein